MALQAIHGAVHAARIGVKYTWFGPGYISNVYFRMIANKPMYKWPNTGGDLSLTSCDSRIPIVNMAVGDPDGKPVELTGW